MELQVQALDVQAQDEQLELQALAAATARHAP